MPQRATRVGVGVGVGGVGVGGVGWGRPTLQLAYYPLAFSSSCYPRLLAPTLQQTYRSLNSNVKENIYTVCTCGRRKTRQKQTGLGAEIRGTGTGESPFPVLGKGRK